MFEVVDTAWEIGAAERERMFERSAGPLSDDAQGDGSLGSVGLYVARRLARALGRRPDGG